MPAVAIVAGFWAQNIGNAFINLGGDWLIRQALDTADVGFVRDQPGYLTFHKQSRGNPKHAHDLIADLDVDIVVLQGAVLTRGFPFLWSPTFRALRARGTQVLLLGVGFSTYDDQEVADVRAFLTEFPPTAVVTRDRVTFEAIRDCVPLAYDGIDSAFALPRAYSPVRLDSRSPYVVLTFDHFPEPRIDTDSRASADATSNEHGDQAGEGRVRKFEFAGSAWKLSMPALQYWCARRGRIQAYLGAAVDRRRLDDSVGGLEVVRCEHRFQPHVAWKLYRRPKVVVSDEPFTYCSLYSQTSLTLTDRVHAAVASLAYGRPAMLMGSTPRASLAERVGVPELFRKPVTLATDRRDEELSREVQFLTKAFS